MAKSKTSANSAASAVATSDIEKSVFTASSISAAANANSEKTTMSAKMTTVSATSESSESSKAILNSAIAGLVPSLPGSAAMTSISELSVSEAIRTVPVDITSVGTVFSREPEATGEAALSTAMSEISGAMSAEAQKMFNQQVTKFINKYPKLKIAIRSRPLSKDQLLDISQGKTEGLLEVAKKFEIKELKEDVKGALMANVPGLSQFQLYIFGKRYDMPDLAERHEKKVKREFPAFLKENLNEIVKCPQPEQMLENLAKGYVQQRFQTTSPINTLFNFGLNAPHDECLEIVKTKVNASLQWNTHELASDIRAEVVP